MPLFHAQHLLFSKIGSSSTAALPGISNSGPTTCSPDILVLGNVESLYQAAVKAIEPTKSHGQVSSGHPVFPVTLPDLTSPPPPLPSPSKVIPAAIPLSAAVGSNRPVAAVTAMNNSAADTTYKTAVGIGNIQSSASTAGVPTATIESLNKRMKGLSLCNADLLRQLADKEKQLQRMIKTVNAQDIELDAARTEIARLKERDVLIHSSAKTDESNKTLTAETSRAASTKCSEPTTNASDNHLIISLQKQLESEKLNSRNLKQQLEIERVHASRISDKQNFSYNKVNQNTSIHSGNVAPSTPLLGGGSQNNLDNSISTNFASGSDSFGLRGLIANATQQHSTQHIDACSFDGNPYERLVGNLTSEDTYRSISNHSTNGSCLKQPPISTSSPIPSSVRAVNGRLNGSNLLNSAITTQTSSAGLSTLPQHSFARSEHVIGGLNRSNSTGAATQSSGKQNFYTVPSSGSSIDRGTGNRNLGTIGGSGMPLMGLDDSNTLLRSNSIAGGTSTESSISSILQSTATGGKMLSQNPTDSSEDMFKKMANLR